LERRKAWPYLTARDVHTHVIVAATSGRMVRYIELPGVHDGHDLLTGRPYVGEAVHFFSYSWDSPWQEIVDALVAHTERALSEGKPEPYYWIDIFAVNQHLAIPPWACTSGLGPSCPGCAAVSQDMHDWATADPNNPKGFERVISHTRHTLVLMEPWHSPRPPTRVWCLFEQYTTIAKDGQLEVVLSPKQARRLQRSLDTSFAQLKRTVEKIDAREAEASAPQDQVQIFSAIEKLDGGFDALNTTMRRPLARWLAVTAAGVVERKRPDRPPLSLTELETEVGAGTRKCCCLCCCCPANRLARLIELHPRIVHFLTVAVFVGIAMGCVLMFQFFRMALEKEVRHGVQSGWHWTKSSHFPAYATLGICVFTITMSCFLMALQLGKLQNQHQLRAQPLCGAGPRGLRWSWNAHVKVQGWFAYGPFVAFAVLLLPSGSKSGSWLTHGSIAVALWALGLAVGIAAVEGQETEAHRCRLAARAATLRSHIGDHEAAIEQLLAAHSRLSEIYGPDQLDAFTAAPMLLRAYCVAGRQDSDATKALVAEVEAAVDRNSRCCRFPADYVNWIDVLEGEDLSGEWLALRAHMTAAVQQQGSPTVMEQLNIAVANGYRPSRGEDTEQDYELGLVDMRDPAFWLRVKSNHNRRKLKTAATACLIFFVMMVWIVIFFGLIIFCGHSKPLATCSCSPGFTHDYLGPECEEICDCSEARGCDVCCKKDGVAEDSCLVDTDTYLNACGLDMHFSAHTWAGADECEQRLSHAS
jgi:hypothetical protein